MGVSLRDLIKDEIEQEKQEAAKEAKMDEKREMAINLCGEGMDIDFIVRVTKTAKEVVEQWIQSQEED